MSENLDATTAKPQGKGMAIAGFILALVTLVLNNVVFLACVAAIGLGGSGWFWYVWLILNIVGLVLSIMAMSKLKKTGGKRGLAIAGMVIGIVGTVWAIFLTVGMSAAVALESATEDQLRDAFQQGMQKELNDM